MNHYRQTLLLLPQGVAWFYLFPARGCGLPLHSHKAELAHAIACTAGKLRITINGQFGRQVHDLLPGEELLDYELEAPHEIMALEDRSSALNLCLHKAAHAAYKATPAADRDITISEARAMTFQPRGT